MNKNIISIIFDYLDNESISKKVFPTKNKFFRKYAYKRFRKFKGEWNEINPSIGHGEFYNYDNKNKYIGEWKESRAEGLIVADKNKEIIFKGTWNEDLTINSGNGQFSQDDTVYYGVWNEGKFSGKLVSKLKSFKKEYACIFKEFDSGKGSFAFDGKIYSGERQGDNGSGTIKFKTNLNTFIYSGEWIYNKPSRGHGAFIEEDNIYIGEWDNEAGCGQILSLMNESAKFKGRWDNFLWPIEGEGAVIFSNKYTYEGVWEKGEGVGHVRTGVNYVYFGTWNKYGHFLNGAGSFMNSDNNLFVGQWSDGEGSGEIIFNNGEKITAKWDRFRRITEGVGVYYDIDCRKYIGTICDGHGVGSIESLDSFFYDGSWDVNGIPVSGQGIFFHQGVIFKGIWKDSIGKGDIFS